jgi:hypothetical protein
VPEYYDAPGQFTLLNQTFFFPSLAYNVFNPSGSSTIPDATAFILVTTRRF